MARKRMIDPTIWEDEDFGKLPMAAKLLFIGLFSNADDEGKIRANPAYIKSTIFMYDDTTLQEVVDLLERVTTLMKSVRLYEVDGKQYIQLLKWDEYQKQHKDRIVSSTLPPYDEGVSESVGQVTDNVGVDKVKLSKVSLGKDKLSVTNVTVAKPQYGNPQINELLGYFKTTMGLKTLDLSEKRNRYAAQSLLVKYKDLVTVKAITDTAAQDEFYKSNITSLQDLLNKAMKVMARKRSDKPVIATQGVDV